MEFKKGFYPIVILNFLMLLAFSISVNSLTNLPNLNLLFYIFFHLTFIYFCIYYYHFTLYFIAFIYGILFDIFLFNNIGIHLLTFIFFLILYNLTKKYLLQLSSYQIIIVIFFCLLAILYIELIFAYLINNFQINYTHFLRTLIYSVIIYVPGIILFIKIDK